MYFPEEIAETGAGDDLHVGDFSSSSAIPSQHQEWQSGPTTQQPENNMAKDNQETDNEALSSLLMLSKSNAEQPAKFFDQEVNTVIICIFQSVSLVFDTFLFYS